jgi:hypothetical protein
LFVAWLRTHLWYQITARHLKITLFGLGLRRIRLSDIQAVSKRRPTGWAENWCNTVRSSHRMLVIRRNGGLRKFIMISPKNRYVFKVDLERAIQKLSPDSSPKKLITDDDSETATQNDLSEEKPHIR